MLRIVYRYPDLDDKTGHSEVELMQLYGVFAGGCENVCTTLARQPF
jgi:hypothetical protein